MSKVRVAVIGLGAVAENGKQQSHQREFVNPDISVLELREAIAAGASVVDVREPYEWASEHIAGAIHIPLATLPMSLDQLPDGEFFVICHIGARSAMAARWLRAQGLAATNVAGGMDAWVAAALPIDEITH